MAAALRPLPRPFPGCARLLAPALVAGMLFCAPATRRGTEGAPPDDVPPSLRAEAAAAILAAPESLGLTAGSSDQPRIFLGPMVGHTTDRSTTLWLQVDRPGALEVELVGEDGEHRAEGTARAEDGNVAVVRVGGLEPATRYTASFALDGRPLEAPPEVEFSTFPPVGRPGHFRVALVSCARMAWDSVQTIWTTIARDRPDVVLWLGDNNYFEHGDSAGGIPPDYTSLGRMAFRHAQLRALSTLQPVLRTIPNEAMWDDHDYGSANSDRTFPLREGSAVLFTRYWANATYGGPGLDGTWSEFRIGDVDVFMTDDRFWRDPNEDPDSPTKTMLGASQKAWLKERLAASRARVKVVAVGSQVLATYHEWESYARYAHERDELLDWIRANRIEGVVFVSGDRHLSEFMRYVPQGGYPLYELTASPAANRPFVTGLEIPNPIRVDGYGAGFNYGILDIDTTPAGGTIAFKIVDVDGREVFAHAVNLDDLRFPSASGS